MIIFRTGLLGKGVLLHYGPNFACDPVITRTGLSTTKKSQVLVCSTNRNLETWCLPGGTVKYCDVKLPKQRQLPEYLTSVLIHNIQSQKVMQHIEKDDAASDLHNPANQPPDVFALFQLLQQTLQSEHESYQTKWIQQLASFFEDHCELKYKGYCDDPRNTDNAWMETSVHHTHLPDFLSPLLDIGDELSFWRPAGSALQFRFRWMDVDSGLPAYKELFASHFDFVELCVPVCKCGRRRYDQTDESHVPNPSLGAGIRESQAAAGQWVPQTKSGACCGEIQFLGKSVPSHFVRARMQSLDDVHLVRAMLDFVGLEPPDALISVTGGAQDFAMDRQAADRVFSGILRAAITSGACITDGGTDAGVMKLLGEAVERNGHRVNLIGFTGWGTVIGRSCINRGTNRAFYSKPNPNWAGGAGLDPNHRFFLLVDNGTAGEFGIEIEARAKLEELLRHPKAFNDFRKVLYKTRDLEGVGKEINAAGETEKLLQWESCELIKLHRYLSATDSDFKSEMSRIARSALEQVLALPEDANSSGTAGRSFAPRRDKREVRHYLAEIGQDSEIDFQPCSLDATGSGAAFVEPADSRCGGAVSNYTVQHCFKCYGSYRDNISASTFRNSISSPEYNEWFELSSILKGISAHVSIVCKSCGKTLARDEVENEEFYRCTEMKSLKCDHYFFKSRVLDLRKRGRDRIICECCRGRTKVDDILGKFVPGVLVVVQGGVGTIRTVASTNAENFRGQAGEQYFDTLEQSAERCTPVVVVEGSGKAADFIAATWRHMHNGDRRCHGYPRASCIASTRRYQEQGARKRLLPASCPVVVEEHCRIFGDGIAEGERAQQVSWVIETCRRKETITLYHPSKSDAGIDFAIMSAICKGTLCDGQPLSMIEQFQLAIDWNLADKEVSF